MTKKISDKDKKDWENFLSSREKIPNKELDYKKKIREEKIKKIDLHGYTLEKANTAINDFVTKSFNENVTKIIVITGKGLRSKNIADPFLSKDLSILKYSVPEFISSNQNLMKMINDFKDASIDDGGKGAFYIYLRKKK